MAARRRQPHSLVFVSSLRGWGGGEKWLLEAARSMRERGHRAALIVQPHSELAARGRAADLPVHEVRLGGWLAPHSLLGVARALVATGATVICANLDKEIRQTRLAARMAGRRVRLVARRGSPDPVKDTWHYRFVYTRWVDRLIINCEALAAPVLGGAPWFDRDRLWVIPNGVDPAALATPCDLRAELGLKADRPVVACVGEVGWRKGQQHVLDAAASLADRFPDAVWLLAGDGDGLASLTEQAGRRGLLQDGRVRFLGFRPDSSAVLAAADVVVLPSRREGVPNTLLEAMALGRAVAASRADGIGELVVHGETGLLHNIDDLAAFTADVARLLDDHALRRRLGEAGRARVAASFTQAAVMDRVEACLTAW